jgi:hypothetical protein
MEKNKRPASLTLSALYDQAGETDLLSEARTRYSTRQQNQQASANSSVNRQATAFNANRQNPQAAANSSVNRQAAAPDANRQNQQAAANSSVNRQAVAPDASRRNRHNSPITEEVEATAVPPVSPVGILAANNYNVRQLLDMARTGTFHQFKFTFGGRSKFYTPAVQFFEPAKFEFDEKPAAVVEFKCKICSSVLNAKIGRFSNLNQHLDKHDETRKW